MGMRQGLTMLMAAALLIPMVAQAAEHWEKVPGLESVGEFWIDRDSVKVVNGITQFRMKISDGRDGTYGILEATADCAKSTATMVRMSAFDGTGKLIGSHVVPEESATKSLDDDEGAALKKMICA
jgi:hypothetical protein